jgi:hypothetical protein
MSNEATVRTSLQIRKANTDGDMVLVDYQGRPTDFRCDVTGSKGPTPGAITASILGTVVDFSQLTVPGLCRIMNEDPTNFVEYGINENTTGKFYPLGEVGPGESYVLKLSRWLGREWTEPGTGTGTSEGSDNSLMIRADTAACNVLVEAFEK